MQFSNGDFSMFFKKPIALGFIIVAFVYLGWSLISNINAWRKSAKAG